MKTLQELTGDLPEGPRISAHQVQEAAAAAGPTKYVVLDDDPTGTQSVADLPVLNSWTTHALAWALTEDAPATYVMTNSRSLAPADAEQRNREVARAAFSAAREVGVNVRFVSRSDSTMRGHFPLETDVLAQEIAAAGGAAVDGVIIVPAFADAGRITVHATHYAGSAAEGFVPVGESEFARDSTFGYASSDLREWVEEKTGGAVTADNVAHLDIAVLRSDHDASVALLRSLADARPLVVDIVEENDLRLLALALYEAEQAGSAFLYRVGPPFVRALIGQDVHAPLTGADVRAIREGGLAEESIGGLVVVGSHVALTTAQLDELRARHQPHEYEIDVAAVLDPARRDEHLKDIVQLAAETLETQNVVVRTTRTLVKGEDADSSLALSRTVSSAVVEVVQGILALSPPKFVVAKGGITSSDVAARGLQIGKAYVRGPMLPGIVSLWEPVDGPARGIPFIVFAGNVGDAGSLADVVEKLSA